MSNEFWLGQLVDQVVNEIHGMLMKSPQMLHADQLSRSSESIAANLVEAYGRRKGPERNQLLRYADGSVRESKRHLRTNFVMERIPPQRYWPLHNRLIVISKALIKLQQDP